MSISLYQPDLAHVHVDGYGFHWQGAAPAVLKWLRDAGIRTGTVVDLGCGGGQWLALLAQNGYTPVGVDLSPAMLRTTRKLLPTAALIRGSFADIELPTCDAVTSLGEPLNYLPNRASFERTLKHVHRALRAGGLFIFDVRVPAAKPVAPRTTARTGNDWACISIIDEHSPTPTGRGQVARDSPWRGEGLLTRHITTFRRRGQAYRRSQEIHELRLYPTQQIRTWLRTLGFRTRTKRSYGDYRLGLRQVVFIAKKPAS